MLLPGGGGMETLKRILNDLTAGQCELEEDCGSLICTIKSKKEEGRRVETDLDIRFNFSEDGSTAQSKRLGGDIMSFHKVMRKLKEQLEILDRMKELERVASSNPKVAPKSRVTSVLGKVRALWRSVTGPSTSKEQQAADNLAKLGFKPPVKK